MPLTEALRAGTEQAQLALWICSAWPAGTDAASIDADPNCGIMRTCTTTLSVVAYQKTSPDLFVCATGAREETGRVIEDIRDYEVPNDVRDWDYGQRYRVVFWDIDDPDWDKLNDPARPVVPPWSENPRRVVGARDVEEVLEWAHANAHGRLFQIYVESDRPPARCVRVYGVEPTDPDEAEEAERRWAELHRSPSS